MFKDTYFFIPARKGSKGFPNKNQKLFKFTADKIPKNLHKYVYVSTDDEEIIKQAESYEFNVINRPEILANDTASVKDVILHFCENQNISNKNIIVLYLTYPQRTWSDVEKIFNYYINKRASSLVCCDNIKEHPYLMFYQLENSKGKQIIEHDFYRRQDYPTCFKLSLYVGIFNSEEVKNLSGLLVNKNTAFYKLEEEKIDVDYLEDYKKI